MAVKDRSAVRVRMAHVFGPNPWDKEKALRLQRNKLLPAVRQGRGVVFDFAGVEMMSQSFAGALVALLRQELGSNFSSRVSFESTNPVLDSILGLATRF